MSGVDFVVNCYERTYRDVLTPGYVAELARQQRHEFTGVTVLVNNVADRGDAQLRAATLLEQDVTVTRVKFVADLLPAAMRATGLKARHIRRLPHFTDCCLVAVAVPGPEWVCYWDADAVLEEPADWISPTMAYMEEHHEILVGGPEGMFPGLAEREALYIDNGFAIGYGFSDVAFLARRQELAAPIYRRVAPASWRYPLAHVEPIFEQRLDAYMRSARRTRATYLGVAWKHPVAVGSNYPTGGLRGRVRRRLQKAAMRAAGHVDHPAYRAWPMVARLSR